MPNKSPPAINRVAKKGLTKEELKDAAPAIQRMSKVNRSADKYKWSK